MSAIDMLRKTAYARYGEKIEIKPIIGMIASKLKKSGELHVVMELQIKID
jgi:hypothetical protein